MKRTDVIKIAEELAYDVYETEELATCSEDMYATFASAFFNKIKEIDTENKDD